MPNGLIYSEDIFSCALNPSCLRGEIIDDRLGLGPGLGFNYYLVIYLTGSYKFKLIRCFYVKKFNTNAGN